MKKFNLYVMTATAMLAFAPLAQADAPSQFAVVNIQKVMSDSTAVQSVREQLDKKQKGFQEELSKKDQALQKEGQELGKKRGVLSKDVFETKDRAFRAKVTDEQKEVQSKKALLDSAFERALAEVQKSVTEIITDMSKEKGFIIAIPTSQILYADSKLDISDEVLKRLNAKLPKVDVKFDAPAAPAAEKKE